VILTLTPYIADTYHDRGMYFAQNDYVFAAVDSRGCGNSDGQFIPFVNEGRDGFDAVEWLARQPWSNGKVGMWGGSYGGYDQWATAAEFPPHLATIVPAASAYPGKNMPMVNNIQDQYWIQYFFLVGGRTINPKISEDRTFWDDKFRELFVRHLPFDSFEQLSGISVPVFREWLKHPAVDDYWRRMVPGKREYHRIRIPILTITGEYDRAHREPSLSILNMSRTAMPKRQQDTMSSSVHGIMKERARPGATLPVGSSARPVSLI
jgi:uncharacterized protein